MIKTEYVPNNTQFQIIASRAWAEFYKVREFLLNQLIVSESKFSNSCKETFLYSFHQIRFWLIELEEKIKLSKHDNLTGEDLEDAIEEIMDELSYYFERVTNVMVNNEDQFDRGFTEIFIKMFAVYKPVLLNSVGRILQKDFNSCFGNVVKFSVQYMSHLLHILYEMDYLYAHCRVEDKGKFYPFIGLDFVDINLLRDTTKVSLVDSRIKVYKEFGLIDRKAYWTIKSYCDKNLLDSDYATYKMFNSLLSEIELQGIRISCVM